MNLPTSGTKAELCDRIIEYEKMNLNPKDNEFEFLYLFLKSKQVHDISKLLSHWDQKKSRYINPRFYLQRSKKRLLSLEAQIREESRFQDDHD